ncbi:MAG: hypothetical protein ACKO6N_05460 [Myxococcota bacterium]
MQTLSRTHLTSQLLRAYARGVRAVSEEQASHLKGCQDCQKQLEWQLVLVHTARQHGWKSSPRTEEEVTEQLRSWLLEESPEQPPFLTQLAQYPVWWDTAQRLTHELQMLGATLPLAKLEQQAGVALVTPEETLIIETEEAPEEEPLPSVETQPLPPTTPAQPSERLPGWGIRLPLRERLSGWIKQMWGGPTGRPPWNELQEYLRLSPSLRMVGVLCVGLLLGVGLSILGPALLEPGEEPPVQASHFMERHPSSSVSGSIEAPSAAQNTVEQLATKPEQLAARGSASPRLMLNLRARLLERVPSVSTPQAIPPGESWQQVGRWLSPSSSAAWIKTEPPSPPSQSLTCREGQRVIMEVEAWGHGWLTIWQQRHGAPWQLQHQQTAQTFEGGWLELPPSSAGGPQSWVLQVLPGSGTQRFAVILSVKSPPSPADAFVEQALKVGRRITAAPPAGLEALGKEVLCEVF